MRKTTRILKLRKPLLHLPVLGVVLALIVAACGGGEATPTPTTQL